MILVHKFVKSVPENMEDGVIYISVDYATAIHKCCCGCGNEVVTPFSPTDWELTFDGKTISLYPSIGNWNFQCRSHYWIARNRVEWCPKWDAKRKNKKKGRGSFFERLLGRKKIYEMSVKTGHPLRRVSTA
jgi:hypothetical protein